MNQIYFTADLHFGHSNILKHSPKRPFSDTVDIKVHDEWLLDLWKSTVDKRDTVYILGDLTFLKCENARHLLEKLPGQKFLIEGNHDGSIRAYKNYFKEVYHFILEVGYIHYRFEVERWLEENNRESTHVEYRLIDTLKDIRKRYSDVPMCIIPCSAQYSRWSHEEQWKEREGRVTNPILAGTFIPRVIPPTDIWNALYAYLSSLRDKPFTDSRSDVQKLESAGFDKKTSFRNIK
jgi:calcineurin-like phosphoesterase family protein